MEVNLQKQEKISITGKMNDLIEQVIELTLKKHNISPREISLLFCDDEKIRELNNTYRKIDSPTDVLSFPMDEEYLGDIVVSMETAERQAKEYGHSLEREVCFLVLHGLLHLLGYDHKEETERVKMREMEEEILGELGLSRHED